MRVASNLFSSFSHTDGLDIGGVFISTLAAQILQDAEVSGKLNPHGQVLAKTIQPIVAFMVLCSIVIHGLSIPSFSLGRRVRSVSRTWSRHAPPDWTIQTRLVERGAADIVINRDSAMEEGRLAADEKVEVETSTKRASTTSSGARLRSRQLTKTVLRRRKAGRRVIAEKNSRRTVRKK